MNLEDRNKRIQEYQQEQMEILDAKGADYTGGKASEDGNHNFSEVARRLAGAPMNAMTVWAVYFLKHCLAVETFVKLGRVESEGMEGRFNDLANYANIGRTIFEDMALKDNPMLGVPTFAEVELRRTTELLLKAEGERDGWRTKFEKAKDELEILFPGNKYNPGCSVLGEK